MTGPKLNKGKNEGRPMKLPAFLKAAEEFFKDHEGDMDIWVYTDSDLIHQINKRLKPEDRIVREGTFSDWKAKMHDEEYLATLSAEKRLCFEKFSYLVKDALIMEKRNLFSMMLQDPIWTRHAWILERKFKEWNIKNIHEVDNKGKIEIERIAKIEYIKPPKPKKNE